MPGLRARILSSSSLSRFSNEALTQSSSNLLRVPVRRVNLWALSSNILKQGNTRVIKYIKSKTCQELSFEVEGLQLPLFIWGTTLYICMNALPFGDFFSLFFVKKNTTFTVLCKHTHFDWQITATFLYAISILLHVLEITSNKGTNSYKLKILKNGIQWFKVAPKTCIILLGRLWSTGR